MKGERQAVLPDSGNLRSLSMMLGDPRGNLQRGADAPQGNW